MKVDHILMQKKKDYICIDKVNLNLVIYISYSNADRSIKHSF